MEVSNCFVILIFCCAAALAFDNPVRFLKFLFMILFHFYQFLRFQHKWETLPLVPHVSGIRVENKDPPTPEAVIGYTYVEHELIR